MEVASLHVGSYAIEPCCGLVIRSILLFVLHNFVETPVFLPRNFCSSGDAVLLPLRLMGRRVRGLISVKDIGAPHEP